jgi:hypothetical protein
MKTPSGAWTGLHLEAQKEEPRNDRIAILPREVCPLPDSQNENFARSGTAPKIPDWFVGPQGQYGSHGPCSSKPPNCRRAGPCFPLSVLFHLFGNLLPGSAPAKIQKNNSAA